MNKKTAKENQGSLRLLKSTGVVGGFTLLSRLLGLTRDIVIAQLFGAGAAADAFFIAFKIPNFFRRLFAEGAFAQAFVPVFSDVKTHQTHDRIKELIGRTFGIMSLTLGLLTLLCMIGSQQVVWLFAPGFHQEPEKMQLASELLQLTFPYLFWIAHLSFAASILNAYGHFATPAAAPVILNISLIVSALWSPQWSVPIMALGWGVFVAGMAQLFLQLPPLMRRDCLSWPSYDLRKIWRDSEIRRIGALMLPAVFGASVSQINLLLDTVLASFLISGSVSWLYYADRLMELPLGVFGIAIGTVILPKLSTQFGQSKQPQPMKPTNKNDPKENNVHHRSFSQTLSWSVRMVLLVGVPSSVALFLLAEPILITLFNYREFSAVDVLQSAKALRAYSIGITAFMLIKVLAPGYFSRQDTKTPVQIAIKAMVFNMALNLLLIWPLQHTGLALATSISACLNVYLLYRGLGAFKICRGRIHALFLSQLIIATAALIPTLWLITPETAQWLNASLWTRLGLLAKVIGIGLTVYVAILFASGMRPRVFKQDYA